MTQHTNTLEGAHPHCRPEAINPFCGGLTENIRCELCRQAREITVKHNEEIAIERIPSQAGIIRSGVLAMELPNEKGGSLTSFLAGPGDIGNVMRVAGPSERYDVSFNDTHRALALVDTSLCLVPLDVMRALVQKDGTFALAIVSKVTDRYKDALSRFTEAKYDTSAQRVAWLLNEFDRLGIDSSEVTHATIARILGMNRVTVTRQMKNVLAQLREKA